MMLSNKKKKTKIVPPMIRRPTQSRIPSNGAIAANNGSVGGSSPTASSTTTDETTVYSVLYYKRKNKVHKSKGVSKMDGILTIVGPPKSLVSLTTCPPTSTTIVAARKETEIVSSPHHEWDDDSILNLGAYEVEILSKLSSSTRSVAAGYAAAGSAATTDDNRQMPLATAAASFPSKNGSLLGRRAVLRPIPIQARTNTIANSSTSATTPSSKTAAAASSARTTKQSCFLPGGITTEDSSSSRTSSSLPLASISGTTTRSTTPTTGSGEGNHQGNKLPTLKRNLPQQEVSTTTTTTTRPLLVGRAFQSRANKRRAFVPLHKKREEIPSSSSSSFTNEATANIMVQAVPSTMAASSVVAASSSLSSSFPGAIGNIDLPHSISAVLKPHQRIGLVFLWNCLTGNNAKRQQRQQAASPHQQHARQQQYHHQHHTTSSTSMGEQDDSDFEEDSSSPYISTSSTYKGGCILADEMGLGKTLMTIATICALYRQRRDQKFIVVCPSSLVSNWAKEFDKWLGNACQPKRVVANKGGQEGLQQIKVFCQPAVKKAHHQAPQILIISYDVFRRNANVFQQSTMPPSLIRLLVVDEGHRLKNTAKSLTLTALESLPCESRLLLTATPIQNVLSDFYTIADFCCPGVLGDLSTFRREFERPISTANNTNCTIQQRQKGATQSRILDEITQAFMLRRLQKDVLQTMLPPRQETMLFCRPSALQSSMYQKLTLRNKNQGGTIDGDGGATTADALKTLTNLRKLCLHPSLLTTTQEGGETLQQQEANIQDSGKVTILDQLLENIRNSAPEDKVVIVSNFTSALGLIERSILKPRGLSYTRLDGSTELSNRQSIVDTFNNTSSERTFAFLLSSKAGGCGLNLIGANRLVMFDPDWNPASDIQAMARVWRQGQQKPCTIYRLFTSGTVEEVICQRQIQKGNLASRAIDRNKNKSSRSGAAGLGFSKEELRDCFTLKKNCVCDTKEKVGDSWAAYDGPASLVAQGCDDAPLIQLASESAELAFVHVVTVAPRREVDDSDDAPEEEDDSSSTGTGMSSEDEWQDSSGGVIDAAGSDDNDDHDDANESSSGEENEFE